nr:integrase, catalytic region, zinc finger, CCHC-type, peptidase aspartic, catalytic [Tanacetum cinerariifolium]
GGGGAWSGGSKVWGWRVRESGVEDRIDQGCDLSWIAFCFRSIAFCLRRPCVLSSEDLAFCLQKILRFVFKYLSFCLGSTVFCLQISCVLPQKHCVLSTSKILCFVFKDCVLLWKNCVLSSKILRFVSEALRFVSFGIAFCLSIGIVFCQASRHNVYGPYKPTTVLVQAVVATDDSPAIPEHTTVETPMNMSPENKAHFQAEKEAIHLILTGIEDEIYSNIYKPTNNNLRTSSNSRNKNVDTTLRYKKDNQSGQFRNQRTVNVAGARENVGSPELEAHYSYMAKIQKVPTDNSGIDYELLNNTCLVETDDRNVIPDSPDMCEDDIQNDQNDVESDDEGVALANLIANLKLDVGENKKIQNQLKKANTTLAQELKECKTILAETSKTLGESNSVRDSCLVALQNKQTEFEKYKEFNDRTIDYDKLELFNTLQAEQYDWLANTVEEINEQELEAHYSYMEKIPETCLMPLAIKTQNDSFLFVHELKQEMHANLKYVESLEKEIDELESDKVEFSNMYDMVLQECVSKDVMCSYLFSLFDLDALDKLQCLYLHKVIECDCLAQKLSKQTESVSKEVHTELLQRFDKVEKHSISLEIAWQKCKEQNIAISELKKLIEKGKGKSVDTKFDKPSVVQQPNSQRIPKPSVLGKPAPFSNSLERIYFSKTKSVPKANVSECLSKPVTAQTLPQTAKQAVSNTNVLKPGMYRIDNRSTQTRAPQLPQTVRNTNPHVSTSTGVNHKTNVSRPRHKSNQLKDKVVPNNSQVKLKKTQVEVHPMIPSVSNKMKSVTACKDNLNSRTLNANAVCATCNKCLVDSNHFACVKKMFYEVNARTKKPNIIQLILFIVDSGCMKHMTGNLKLLCNFVEKFLGNVCFGNDQFASILGYGDLVQENVMINRVYYAEGLNHNLFSVGQFCDADLEVAFRKSTCFVRDLQDKMKEKGDPCILVGYSTQSKGYRVYNKRTRMIVESIYIRFDEIKEVSETSVPSDTSGLVPQRQKASDYDNPNPILQRQDVSSSADVHVPSQQELDLLFGPLSYPLSWKPCQGDSLNLPDHRNRRRCCSLIPAESDSSPLAHALTTNTYYASRFKNQESSNIKTKTFVNSDKQDLLSRYQVYQGRLLTSFQDDAKYEHGGQDTRSQGDKDDQN